MGTSVRSIQWVLALVAGCGRNWLPRMLPRYLHVRALNLFPSAQLTVWLLRVQLAGRKSSPVHRGCVLVRASRDRVSPVRPCPM